MRSIAAICLLLCVAANARADFVFGCELQDGKLPRIVLELLNAQSQVVSTFDSSLHVAWSMPGQYQQPLADGVMQVRYVADDLRAMYGGLPQSLNVQFADLLPPSKSAKHPAGSTESIPLGEIRPVEGWLGSATFFTIAGAVSDGITTSCQWFCQFDIAWGPASLGDHSFGAIKALY